jgi:hypothetical protein
VDFDFMQTHLRVYAAYLWELCTAPVLPFTYVPVAQQIIKRLDDLKAPATDLNLAGLKATARELLDTAERFDAAAAKVSAGFASGKGDEQQALALNRAIKRISRLIVPLMSSYIGKYGHDPYSFTPQSTLMPALYDIERVSKVQAQEERWMLETKVVRDRNKVADTLNDTIDIMTDAVASLG